ncbi:hypothetical protein BX285_3846 [Streptomyces sp. 1114.5]|nr:hypothetical protein BX285_3846 [Streptomyces sp. 1114.5]
MSGASIHDCASFTADEIGAAVRWGNRSWDSITFRPGGKDVRPDMPDRAALRAAG